MVVAIEVGLRVALIGRLLDHPCLSSPRQMLRFAALMSGRVLLAAILLCAELMAQAPAPLIANVGGRRTISLNGEWHAIADQYDVGAIDYRGKPQQRPFFANAKPQDKSELIEY